MLFLLRTPEIRCNYLWIKLWTPIHQLYRATAAQPAVTRSAALHPALVCRESIILFLKGFPSIASSLYLVTMLPKLLFAPAKLRVTRGTNLTEILQEREL